MSRRLDDGEERHTMLDRFAGVMDFLSRDSILVPFSYVVICLGASFGAYQILNRETGNKVEQKMYEKSLESIAYDLPNRQR